MSFTPRPCLLFYVIFAIYSSSPACSFTASRHSRHPTGLTSSTLVQATPAQKAAPFQYTPTSLKHLENTELADDYSRPWTETKIKALATGMAVGSILGVGGEMIVQTLFDVEKTFVIWGALGIGAGWFLGGGKQVAEAEKPINGGYDRKLIADRPSRLQSVLDSVVGDSDNALHEEASSRDLTQVRSYASMVHSEDYLQMLESKSKEADRPQRLNPVYSRTLIDEHSFDAALNAAADWMRSVDGALQDSPRFALVRPPSHHACRGKGMGGCLVNSVSIAALYALDQPGVSSVAILDIDAHHGNGIAHCIQDNPSIRYCSIHEDTSSGFLGRSRDDPADPRSATSEDVGPLGNIRNINLPSGTGWDTGYQVALEQQALPFLLTANNDSNTPKPDILLVAAGFDALDADLTSKLKLKPTDFKSIANLLKGAFGNRVAFGLEGGYCWQGGELSEAILQFVEPWR